MDGYVKIVRGMVGSSIWKLEGKCLHVAIGLILEAEFMPVTRTIEQRPFHVKRGQVMTTMGKLSKRFGFKRQTIAAAIAELVRVKFCSARAYWRHTLITIFNYEKYQGGVRPADTITNSPVRPADTIGQDPSVERPGVLSVRRTGKRVEGGTEEASEKNSDKKAPSGKELLGGGDVSGIARGLSELAKDKTKILVMRGTLESWIDRWCKLIGPERLRTTLDDPANEGMKDFLFDDVVRVIATSRPRHRDLYGAHLAIEQVESNMNRWDKDSSDDYKTDLGGRIYSKLGGSWKYDAERTAEREKALKEQETP